MADVNTVDWQALGGALGGALLAAGAAYGGARRMWRKGLADLLRPVLQAEVSEAVRTAMHEEIARLRRKDRRLDLEMGALQDRMARIEGAVEVLTTSRGTTNLPPRT